MLLYIKNIIFCILKFNFLFFKTANKLKLDLFSTYLFLSDNICVLSKEGTYIAFFDKQNKFLIVVDNEFNIDNRLLSDCLKKDFIDYINFLELNKSKFNEVKDNSSCYTLIKNKKKYFIEYLSFICRTDDKRSSVIINDILIVNDGIYMYVFLIDERKIKNLVNIENYDGFRLFYTDDININNNHMIWLRILDTVKDSSIQKIIRNKKVDIFSYENFKKDYQVGMLDKYYQNWKDVGIPNSNDDIQVLKMLNIN